MNHQLM
ncbi:hypothetical protein YPPY52_4226, partial [Yersinia pestis PY-52]